MAYQVFFTEYMISLNKDADSYEMKKLFLVNIPILNQS